MGLGRKRKEKERKYCWGLRSEKTPGHPQAALLGTSQALSRKAPCGMWLPDLQWPCGGVTGT